MKFFADTADTAEIESLAATGLLDGVTTNPSLIAKSGRNFLDVIREIAVLTPGPVSAEVVAADTAGMLREAAVLRKLGSNICIKLPLTLPGLAACKALSDEGVITNVTLCDLRQLRLSNRNPGRQRPPPGARSAGGKAGCRCRDDAAGGDPRAG